MTHTKHTDSVEAAEKEYQRQLAIATSVGEKYPHISAFIGAWDVYDGMMNDCYMTSKDRAQMRKMLTTLQATQSQQVEEAVRKMFNLNELEKEWQEHFYESEWHPDTLEKTQLEKDIEKELGTFLPRHMDVYDWNLPYIDFITLVVRKHIKKALTPNHQD